METITGDGGQMDGLAAVLIYRVMRVLSGGPLGRLHDLARLLVEV